MGVGQPTQAGSYATGVQYFPNGAMKQFTYGNGLTHTLTQNARQLPLRSVDSGDVLDLTWSYDANGNVAAVSDGTTAGRQTRSMGYDGLDRLLTTTSPMYPGGATYAYDVLDNLTRVSVAGRDHRYQYDASNRLTSATHGPGGPVALTLAYDARGNLSNRNGQAFTFDLGNRLRAALGTESYRYDAQGRRARTSMAPGLLYEAYGQAGKLLWQRDESVGFTFQHVYLNGSVVALHRRPIVSGGSGEVVYYWHTDAQGSQVALTVGTTVLQTSEYEPYGKLLNRPNNNRVGYTGHVMDAGTGLTYMQQRYMDPGLGVFLSVDPVTAYSNPVGMFNRYRYTNNNPYRFVDPDGRRSMLDHPGISPGSVQGIERDPGSEAAPMPIAENKRIEAHTNSKGKVDRREADAVDMINSGLKKARSRVDDSHHPALINTWNKASWNWSPNNPHFVKDPELAAYVNPSDPYSIFLGFRMAEFASNEMKFSYHNATFIGGQSAITFAVLHEFGHVWTAGQGVPGPSRERLANAFAFGMLSVRDRREITCIGCK